jgi:hypothetical protein
MELNEAVHRIALALCKSRGYQVSIRQWQVDITLEALALVKAEAEKKE